MKKLIIGKDTEWGYTDLETDFNNLDEGVKETGEHIFIADPYKMKIIKVCVNS